MSIDRLHEMTQADAVARLESVIEQRDADLAEKLAVKTREARRFRMGGLLFFVWALFATWSCNALLGKLDQAEQAADRAQEAASELEDCRVGLGDVTEQLDTATRQTADVTLQRDTAVELIDEAMAAWHACRRGAR